MANITNWKLAIQHDHRKKLANVDATCDVEFNSAELCLMKNCEGTRFWKLKCELWADDPDLLPSWLGGQDDKLFTFNKVVFFPDASPAAVEHADFKVTVGEGLLDEDVGRDEIYARFKLTNLSSGQTITKRSNVVRHHF